MTVAQWRARWHVLAPREKVLVAAAAVLVGLALTWWIALAPALRTLQAAPQQHRQLDAQLQHMRQLQAEARTLQGQPRHGGEAAMRQLEQGIRQQLGLAARYSIAGDRVTITLAGVSGPALAGWLAQARVDAAARPGEARLARNAAGTWDGTLVVTVPAAP